MKTRKIVLALLGVTFWIALGFASTKIGASLFHHTEDTKTTQKKTTNKNAIQVALLLDTSGSMSGLIEQAKSQLWNILNELARTEKNGEDTSLEIALYEYGNPSKTRKANQINQLTSFTTDMDLISEKLFALKTSGGDEFCGTVIQTSLEELEWKHKDGLKIIYIAGNEEFTQGMVSYEKACANARIKDITINTVYCGDYQTGINEFWKKGALAGGGEYLNINHNQETVYIKTPYDKQINELNVQLNNTYIPYGKQGKTKLENLRTQDSNSFGYSSSNAADRAAFKSSKKYNNAKWDLVDAYKNDKEVLKSAEVVTDSLQGLSIEALEAEIQEVSQRRSTIQQQIQELDAKRRAYKAEQQAKKSNESSLQQSIISTIRKQAMAKGYEVKE